MLLEEEDPRKKKESYSPKGLGSDRDGDGGTSVDDLLATDETIGTVHGNGTDSVLTEVLGDLEDETATLGLGLALSKLNVKSVENRWEVIRLEVDVDDGTNDLLDGTGLEGGSRGVVASGLGCWKVSDTFLVPTFLGLRNPPWVVVFFATSKNVVEHAQLALLKKEQQHPTLVHLCSSSPYTQTTYQAWRQR